MPLDSWTHEAVFRTLEAALKLYITEFSLNLVGQSVLVREEPLMIWGGARAKACTGFYEPV